MPDIAVLFPVYNPGPELDKTLDSLRIQTMPFRLYLVDDGSKQKPDYVKLTAGMDCRIIELPQNLGITGALNAGLAEILKGDYAFVARMDNGDLNEPRRFEKQCNYLNAHPSLSIVSCNIRYKYESTGLVFDANLPEDPAACTRLLRYNAPIAHAAMMFRKDFLKALNAYPEGYPAAEDYALEFWAYTNGYKFCNLPEILYTTIEMSESISGGSRAKQLRSRLRLNWELVQCLRGACVARARACVSTHN